MTSRADIFGQVAGLKHESESLRGLLLGCAEIARAIPAGERQRLADELDLIAGDESMSSLLRDAARVVHVGVEALLASIDPTGRLLGAGQPLLIEREREAAHWAKQTVNRPPLTGLH